MPASRISAWAAARAAARGCLAQPLPPSRLLLGCVRGGGGDSGPRKQRGELSLAGAVGVTIPLLELLFCE